ncbi:prophage tail fiber N-terminal domain-containing protein [Plesiomonas shigelloides]|uniref:prophage tail fiber N-terminal domain-containing protein n=1 Tax=Plesiomonas shigelloides TaxID=703 RepID=UPI001E342752|nr:prophage tail fiber N-terminal domain-containing protein [Plesiomonas shigelloides]
MVKISGRLVEPADDKPRSGVTLTLQSVKNSSVVLKHATYRCVTGGNGEYSFNAAPGTYAVAVSVYGAEPERVGQIRVYSDSLPGNLNTFLMAPGESDLTPEIIRLVDSMRSEAVKAAESAKVSEQIVTKSARDVAEHAQQVASDKVVVAQNTQNVSTKAQQVAENANSVSTNMQSVSQMRDEVAAKTSMAQGAADTATQKAASAAGHDAAAAEHARRAQEAAQATAGALIDGGAADLSGGVYPQPVAVGSIKRPTFWKVTKGGTVGGVDYGLGDTLIYTVAGSGSYYKIDNTESVTSVQGEKGAVTLTPEKIGADAAGTAAASINQHTQKAGAHPIIGVSGLQEALASKFPLSGGKLSGNVEIMANRADIGAVQVDGELPARETTAALRCIPTAGGWSQWGISAPATLIDCQNQNAAYTVWKAMHFGVGPIAAVQVSHRPDLVGMVRLQVKSAAFDFTGNGNLTCASLTQLSDLRKKKNVSLLAGESRSVLDTLRQVEIIRYDENVFPDIDGRKGRIGYNAQQLVKVMPEMVHMDLDGFYSVAYTDMSAANTAAIQELAAVCEVQQEIILEMQKQIAVLMSCRNE